MIKLDVNSLQEHCYRALTPSFSFGRYESDLDWGKWSCFTQNRCLEEVQKLSKPGTVAAMKSYFEARYKRVVNKKSSSVLSNQQNEVPRDSHSPGFMKIQKKSQMVSDSTKFSKDVSCYVAKENDCLLVRCYFLTMLSTLMLLQKQLIQEMP